MFSDKRVKGIAKAAAKAKKQTTSGKKQRKSNVKKPRYFIPLMFNAPDGKTVIRRMKVLDVRDDRKYEELTPLDWELKYGKLLVFHLDHYTANGIIPHFELNKQFDFDLFMTCGGITNSKFWDLNLRYAESACKLDE